MKSATAPEINGLVIGPYNVDLFITEAGKLGLSIDRNDGRLTYLHTLDVFIPCDLNPKEIHAG